MPDTEDFEARYDAETLVRAKQILKDQGWVRRAQVYAEEQRDAVRHRIRSMFGTGAKG